MTNTNLKTRKCGNLPIANARHTKRNGIAKSAEGRTANTGKEAFRGTPCIGFSPSCWGYQRRMLFLNRMQKDLPTYPTKERKEVEDAISRMEDAANRAEELLDRAQVPKVVCGWRGATEVAPMATATPGKHGSNGSRMTFGDKARQAKGSANRGMSKANSSVSGKRRKASPCSLRSTSHGLGAVADRDS